MTTPVTVDELAAEQATEIMLCARQQASNILSMAYDLALREVSEESSEIPKSRKIQVIHGLCEDGIISEKFRDEILLQLGFAEMDPV